MLGWTNEAGAVIPGRPEHGLEPNLRYCYQYSFLAIVQWREHGPPKTEIQVRLLVARPLN